MVCIGESYTVRIDALFERVAFKNVECSIDLAVRFESGEVAKCIEVAFDIRNAHINQ
jgi:hypothetical protein